MNICIRCTQENENIVGIVRISEVNIEDDNLQYDERKLMEKKIWNALCTYEYNAENSDWKESVMKDVMEEANCKTEEVFVSY